MKKIFSILTPLFVSLLFFIPNVVKAQEIELSNSLISSQLSLINSDFFTIKDNLSCSSSRPYYTIFYYNNSYWAVCRNSSYFQLYSSSRYLFYFINSGVDYYKLVNGSVVTASKPVDYIDLMYLSTDPVNMSAILYYSDNITNFLTPLNNTYYFTYNSVTYSFVSDQPFPSLYSIYLDNQSPSDPTPLLTQFFDITIDKLQLICDFITSSYIYLSIIVIFLIYFSILLLRRLK